MLSSELLLENRMKQRLLVAALCWAINQKMRLFSHEKCDIAIKFIISVCEKDVNHKTQFRLLRHDREGETASHA